MNASQPTDFNVSLGQLLDHSRTEPYCHWGIVCYDGKGCRSFLDPNTEGLSPLTRLLAHYPIRSQMAIARLIRCQSRYSLAESEPFTREWQGRYWSCSFEGSIVDAESLPLGRQLPIGPSLTEQLFCHLLHRLDQLSADLGEAALLLQLAAEIEYRLGADSRLLLCNDQFLLLFSRQPLYWQSQLHPDGQSVVVSSQRLVTSHPLASPWQRAPGGQPLLFHNGALLTTARLANHISHPDIL